MYQKFIINSGRIVSGDVDQHRHLATNHSSTRGGGWFHIDEGRKHILLYRQSLEFGPARRHDLLELVKMGHHDFPGYRFSHSHSGVMQEAWKDAVELD